MSSIYEQDVEARLLKFAYDNGEATIVSYLKMGRQTATPIMETFEKLIYALANDKKQYFDMAKKEIDNRPPKSERELE